MTERRLLQAAILVCGLVPVLAGLTGALRGAAMFGVAGEVTLDSQLQYLSGLLLGIGLAFWGMVPRIEARAAGFRLLTAIVAVGGVARLLGLVLGGVPALPMVLALGMELGVTPLLCLWQGRIARKAQPPPG